MSAARLTASAPIASKSRWRTADRAALYAKLEQQGLAGEVDVGDFKRYGSARTLYHFHVDNAGAY